MNRPNPPKRPNPYITEETVYVFSQDYEYNAFDLTDILKCIKDGNYKDHRLQVEYDPDREEPAIHIALNRLRKPSAESLAEEQKLYDAALAQYKQDYAMWEREQLEQRLEAARQEVATLEGKLGKT